MKKLDVAAGCLLIAFGAVHISMTSKFDPTLGMNALWFASGGLLLITIGVLNLLRVAYAVAKGVRIVSVIANFVFVLMMLFMVSRAPIRGNPQVLVGLILAGVLTGFSVFRRGGQPQARHVSQ